MARVSHSLLLWLSLAASQPSQALAVDGPVGERPGLAIRDPGSDLVVDIRALPDAPSGDYAPEAVDCPSDRPRVRLADSLSEQEESWVRRRRNNTIDPMRSLLERANISDFDAAAYIDRVRDNATALPNIAIAASGGGYRALMNGAGFLSAADSRNDDSLVNDSDDDSDDGDLTNGVRGLLQASTYLAGLSGGGWLVGSMFANNFSTVPQLQAGSEGSSLWRFDRSIFRGPEESGIGALNTVDYWTDIIDEVGVKSSAGFQTSITDFWGRALSYQLINASEGGPAYTYSSIARTDKFDDAETPFPILVADGRAPGERIISLNATVYEFNPYEMGTWDPSTYGFAPLRYLGSNFTNGTVPDDDDDECVRGFDQLGFVMGTSSSLFNQFLLANVTAVGDDFGVPTFVTRAIQRVLDRLDRDENDIAQYQPNPFYGWNPTSSSLNNDELQLSLVDGGSDLQNIPLHPLIQPFRGVDVIFAIDSSADTNYNWPNGTAMRATYDRAGTEIANGTLFPPVPDAETFINQGLNRRPTFFGCDASNFTLPRSGSSSNETTENEEDPGHTASVPPPLVVYLPNAPYTAESNVSTFTPSYPLEQRDAIIRNGFNAATQGNGTLDDEWPVCVACAVLSRSWWKAGESAPEACNRCFDRYCWNGTIDDASVESYEPDYIIGADWVDAAGGLVTSGVQASCVAALIAALLLVA